MRRAGAGQGQGGGMEKGEQDRERHSTALMNTEKREGVTGVVYQKAQLGEQSAYQPQVL